MSSIDQQFVEFIVKSLVGNPDAVSIVRTIDEKGVLLELTVAPEDLGRVIGKRGATAQSLRTLLRALGTKNDARYNLKIVDVNVGVPSVVPAAATPVADDTDDAAEEEEVGDEAVEEALAAQKDEPAHQESEPEEDVISKTRKELADLDDLDV